jgi:hypothetical protein
LRYGYPPSLICFRTCFLPTWGQHPVWTRFAIYIVSHRQLLPLYPQLLLTASVILLTTSGPVSILNPDSFSLFINHNSTDTAILTLISFDHFSISVDSFSPPLFGGQSDTSLYPSSSCSQNLEYQTECRLNTCWLLHATSLHL